MKTRITSIAFAVLLTLASVSAALANPSPPTNGGNGGGASGQCTGSAHDRPNGCHTSK